MAFKIVTAENIKDFKNFEMKELKCHCNGKYCNGYPANFSYDLLQQLQNIRTHFGKAVIITSGLRCQRYNDSLKGSVKNSKHLHGKAVDFYVKGISYAKLWDYVRKLPNNSYTYNISGSVMHRAINPPELYNLTRELKKICNGSDVKELQTTLKAQGYSIGSCGIDGVFGNDTEKAVKKFQKDKKIKVDGIVGKDTAHKLGWLYKGK